MEPEPEPEPEPVAAVPDELSVPQPVAVAEADTTDQLEADLAELEAEAAAEPEETAPEPVAAAPWEESQPEPEPEPKPRRVSVSTAVYEPPPVASSSIGTLQHYVDVNQFMRDTKVSEATLDSCMIEQNGLRAFYGAQAAQAEAQASRMKSKFEVIEAKLYDEHRKGLVASGEKVTEKMVENAVKVDSRWLRAKNLVIESESIAAINKSMVESLKDRRDMIIQLGADRRDEYKGQARVMAAQNERDSTAAAAAAAGRAALSGARRAA